MFVIPLPFSYLSVMGNECNKAEVELTFRLSRFEMAYQMQKFSLEYTYLKLQFICILESRVLDGEFLYTKILEVKLFAFACRLFHRDFSPLNGAYCFLSGEKSL